MGGSGIACEVVLLLLLTEGTPQPVASGSAPATANGATAGEWGAK